MESLGRQDLPVAPVVEADDGTPRDPVAHARASTMGSRHAGTRTRRADGLVRLRRARAQYKRTVVSEYGAMVIVSDERRTPMALCAIDVLPMP